MERNDNSKRNETKQMTYRERPEVVVSFRQEEVRGTRKVGSGGPFVPGADVQTGDGSSSYDYSGILVGTE